MASMYQIALYFVTMTKLLVILVTVNIGYVQAVSGSYWIGYKT